MATNTSTATGRDTRNATARFFDIWQPDFLARRDTRGHLLDPLSGRIAADCWRFGGTGGIVWQ